MSGGLVYGSVCSGIEAASVAWQPFGWRAAFVSDIDPFARAVLAHRFPDVPLRGDFTEIQAGDHEPIDLLVGGTPCQSFSVAGLRGGLDDERGNLALEFLRLAQRLRPEWLVWENVPGVLSSNGGRDFGAILGGMVELGYGFAYRVLDAQFVRVDGLERAVPQRRRRVFVVGHLGDWRAAAAVLFESEGMRGDSPPRREAGQGVAGTLAPGLGGGGGHQHRQGDLSTLIADNLIAFSAKDHGGDACQDVSPTLRAGGHDKSHANAGVMPAIAYGGNPPVPVAYRTSPNCGAWETGDRVDALTTGTDSSSHVIVFAENSRAEVRLCGGDGAVAAQLTTGGGKPGQGFPAVATGYAVRRLTPRECERLQGFPDDFTLVPYRGKPASDGPRYRAIGNSMAVNVMRWIGGRIDRARALTARAA